MDDSDTIIHINVQPPQNESLVDPVGYRQDGWVSSPALSGWFSDILPYILESTVGIPRTVP